MEEASNLIQRFIAWTKLKIRIHLLEKETFFQEREIWWASLGANIGHEQDGKNETFERPVLVLKKFNLELMWILPFTSIEKTGRYYQAVEYHGRKYFVILSQLRLISAKRLRRKVRTLPMEEFNLIRGKVKSFL